MVKQDLATRTKVKLRKKKTRSLVTGLLFISPWIVGFLGLAVYPIFSSLWYSFTEYTIISPPKFVGFDNYRALLTDDVFQKGMMNTLYMVVFGVSLSVIVTLTISVLLNSKKIVGLSVYRVVFFIPTLVPLVILAVLWIWMFQPQTGMVNLLLSFVGIQGPGWFASPAWAKPTFILMLVWTSGNMIIIFLAGLQEIPTSLYEAVEIDGGNAWHKALHIAIPLLKPMILYNVIIGIIRVLQSFAEPFIITGGGPNNETMFIGLYIYRSAFGYYQMGYAATMAWIVFIIAFVFAALLFKFTRFGRN